MGRLQKSSQHLGEGSHPNTGYRLPLIVISPFTKKNYVSHTVADYTAMLKFIETRFNVPSLTKRDAAQMDMTEFFDFQNVPWATPPTPPAQASGGVCNSQQLGYP
jgi:phospholipase C